MLPVWIWNGIKNLFELRQFETTRFVELNHVSNMRETQYGKSDLLGRKYEKGAKCVKF